MSFNGSGTFIINSAGQPVVANTVISATVFNALTADLATGLTNCITRDGQSTPTANIPMGNNKLTGLGAGTAATDAATLGQVQSTAAKLITVTGTDTIAGTMSPALTAYASGQLFYFIANAANTGAMTINIDGLGAKNITRDGSTALIAGDVVSGEIVVICYDGTRFQMINAANSFGNTTINGTLTVTGNTGLQANVSITSALSVGGVFAVTGAATLGSTLSVTGKSDLPTVSTASMNAAVAVITTGTVTNLTATSASVASMNAGVALLTTATVTTLTATGASIASANIGNLQFTAASIASINAGVAVITNLTVTGASIASMNGSVANITTVNATTVDATNVEVTNVKAKDGTSAITIADSTGAVTLSSTATATKFIPTGNVTAGNGMYLPAADTVAFSTGGSERVRIDTSGNVGIGTASPAVNLNVAKSADGIAARFQRSSGGGLVDIETYNAIGGIGTADNIPFRLNTNNTERMRIDSSGNVGIGVTTFGNRKLETGGTLPSSGGYSYVVLGAGTFPSGATTEANCFTSFPATQAASFTIPALNHFIAVQSTFGASSVVTNQYGFRVDSSLTGATNNYGFFSNIASGSNRWNFYAAGTARNYFAGRTDVGNTRVEASNNWNGVKVDATAGVSVADGATVTLTSTLCGAVLVTVYDTTSGDGGVFFANYSGTVTKLAGDGAATDTGSTFAVYKSAASHTLTFKNKYGGAARAFRISLVASQAD